MAQDEHRSNETDLRKDKRALKVELKEQELSHEDIIKNLKKVHNYIYGSMLRFSKSYPSLTAVQIPIQMPWGDVGMLLFLTVCTHVYMFYILDFVHTIEIIDVGKLYVVVSKEKMF